MTEKIKTIANHYGMEKQTKKLSEELAELLVEVTRFITNHNYDIERLTEEIADVEVMIAQIKYLGGLENSVDIVISEKIERQLKRIKEEI